MDTLVGLDEALKDDNEEKAQKQPKDIDVLRGELPLGMAASVMK